MARSTEQIFQDHMRALLNGDFPALIADYAADAVLMTMDGANVGKSAIQGYFVNALAALPNFKLSPPDTLCRVTSYFSPGPRCPT